MYTSPGGLGAALI